ncbi:hypothetical protein AGMMS50212_13740 [Spirochaetia bacterium]|nr:hypothetical protein AGMMS50212_13740 [Spirochaetia bacterium]
MTALDSVEIKPLVHYFTGNTFVYQQWSPKKYTIKFDSNGIGKGIAALNGTLTDIDAAKASKSGVAGGGGYYGGNVNTSVTSNNKPGAADKPRCCLDRRRFYGVIWDWRNKR